ncbi:imidazolonepropionase [Candidatus Peregrinibacteria bacterium]|nr:imidazolonepropionase [Candidatus Peregrinibacteria bacterium]
MSDFKIIMMPYSLLIKNCGQLLTMKGIAPKAGKAASELGIIEDAFLACLGDEIVEVGSMKKLKKAQVTGKTKVIDAAGKVVMPGIIDCHTHLVFGGSRAHEFRRKLEGESYLDILASGGGIYSTVKETRKATNPSLLERTMENLEEFLAYGVTTVEAKTGYGLDLQNELKCLDVAHEAAKKQPVRIVHTFLGAHVCAPELKGNNKAYLKYLVEEVLPAVRGKAEFVDIFCEKNAFSVRQAKKYLMMAQKMGFKIKIHAEQINRLGASRMAAELGATSIDHCDHLHEGDIRRLVSTDVVAVLLPLVPLYTGESTFARGGEMVDQGLPVAISTDFNPGSCPSKNIFLAMNLACLKMGLTAEEVLTAVTINAACALDRQKEIGSLIAGKKADILITKVDSYEEIPYRLGENLAGKVIVAGKLVKK